jgi:hypothetical protein
MQFRMIGIENFCVIERSNCLYVLAWGAITQNESVLLSIEHTLPNSDIVYRDPQIDIAYREP